MVRKKSYGNSETLWRVFRSACFFQEERQENGVRIVKNDGGSKILRNRVPYYF